MATEFLDPRVYGRTGLQEFTEGASPYLQMAFQAMLKRKFEEQQQQKILKELGIGTEKITPEGLKYARSQILKQGTKEPGGGMSIPTSQLNIPDKFKKLVINRETLATLPEGLKVPLGYGMEYEKPKEDYVSKLLSKGINPFTGTLLSSLKPASISDVSTEIPSGESPEDYILKPEMRSFRGIPQLVRVPTKKPPVPREDLALIKDLDSNISDLQSNLNFLVENPKVKEFLGPGIIQRPGAIADIATQVGLAPKGFATFKAKSDLAFQKYRKWVTGVQAGYSELQWIVVDYPKPTDNPDIYISKALSAIEGMQRNKQIYLDYLSANNYAVSKIRTLGIQSQQLTQQPQEQGGTQLDVTTAQKILQQAGGDKNKAREIARQMGYIF